MDIEDLDQQLDRLRAAAGRAGANLFELDQSPSVALLDAGRLVGDSARRWDEAKRLLAELFESFTRLSAVIDAAVALRGSRPTLSASRRDDLAHLLLGPSVELPERAVPLAERDLVAGSRTLQRCTADELLASMAQSFDIVREVVVAAAEAWDGGGPRVQLARERLTAIEAATVELEPPLAGLGSLKHRLDELDSVLISDPLAFEVAELDALEHRLTALEAEVEAAHETQVGFDDDVEAARALLAELTEAVESARRSQAHVSERVLTSTAVPPVELDALGAELEHITALARAGAWRPVSADLPRWRQHVERERRAVDAVSAEHQRLLAERQQLRGRLDAYTAKAGRLGHVEDPGLEELQRQATELLFSAPVDLAVGGGGGPAVPGGAVGAGRGIEGGAMRCQRDGMPRRDPRRLLRRLRDGPPPAATPHRPSGAAALPSGTAPDGAPSAGTSGTEVLGGSAAPSAAWAPPSIGSAPSSRSGTVASRPRRLGVGLVEVPRVPARDPATAVMAEAHVAEQRRFCGECNEPVGRSRETSLVARRGSAGAAAIRSRSWPSSRPASSSPASTRWRAASPTAGWAGSTWLGTGRWPTGGWS